MAGPGGGGGLLKDSESEDLGRSSIDLCKVLVSEVFALGKRCAR